MSKAHKFLLEMAFSRNKWIERVRDLFLGGALREYTKIVISKEIGKEDYWSNEVKGILSNIPVYMSDEVLLSRKFDREKMLAEAIREAATFQEKITKAKNKLVDIYPDKIKEIMRLKLNSKALMISMIEEFLPQYKELL